MSSLLAKRRRSSDHPVLIGLKRSHANWPSTAGRSRRKVYSHKLEQSTSLMTRVAYAYGTQRLVMKRGRCVFASSAIRSYHDLSEVLEQYGNRICTARNPRGDLDSIRGSRFGRNLLRVLCIRAVLRTEATGGRRRCPVLPMYPGSVRPCRDDRTRMDRGPGFWRKQPKANWGKAIEQHRMIGTLYRREPGIRPNTQYDMSRRQCPINNTTRNREMRKNATCGILDGWYKMSET
ncbi:hypothetical protein C8Q76DRAFT_361207 [Earliella scabrosa]|nr:hypothetical protein C8Q76DRAFT_361207 [Earliella scabrosa]